MKITQEIIESFSYDDFEDKIKLFTLLIFMHKYGVINDERLSALFDKVRKNPNERKRTYHCTINDKWYQDEKFIDILYDVWVKHHNYPGTGYEMGMEELIKYTNRFLNKPRNYCIDWIRSHVLEILVNRIETWNIHRLTDYFESFGISTRGVYVSEHSFEPPSYSYCCEDCSGPWEDYKASRYREQVVDETARYLETEIVNVLDTFKKKYPLMQKS
jgi:hypothetical protein